MLYLDDCVRGKGHCVEDSGLLRPCDRLWMESAATLGPTYFLDQKFPRPKQGTNITGGFGDIAYTRSVLMERFMLP